MTKQHKYMPANDVHAPHSWVVANTAERLALQVSPSDVGKKLRQTDTGVEYTLTSATPATWSGGSASSFLVNGSGLKTAMAAVMNAVSSAVILTLSGDSLIQLGGDAVNLSSDTLAETQGFGAHLRREMNSRLGLSAFDGGQWLPPDATASDTRVANGGGAALVTDFTAYSAFRDAAGAIVARKGVRLSAGGHTVTYTVNGRYLEVMSWENSATGFHGTYSYTIDGGSAVNVATTGLQDTFRRVVIDLGTQGAHTVVLTWVTTQVLIAGAMLYNERGVATARFGVGGTTAKLLSTRNERVLRTTYKTLSSPLHIIRLSYNDWATQVAASTTPTTFANDVQALITLALLNPTTKGVVLMADPPPSSVDNLAYKYAEFTTAMKALAVGNVAFFDETAALGNYARQNGFGWYVDFVHRTAAGHAVGARLLAAALLDPFLLTE